MAEPLSPAAQAVLDAWLSSERGERMLGNPACLAAALRAAVAATQMRQYGECWICGASELLAIATELEGDRQGEHPPADETTTTTTEPPC